MIKIPRHQLVVRVWDEDQPVFKESGEKKKVMEKLKRFWKEKN